VSSRPRTCLIFNPDLPVLGGGERYTVALGDVIAESHDVTYAARNAPDPARLELLGFPPLAVQVLQDHEFPEASRGYDLAVVVTMNVPPPSFAGQSLVVAQFPLEPQPGATRALRHYDCLVYSEFVRTWLVRRWGVSAEILMPGIELSSGDGSAKERLILSVARFVGALSDDWSKRQDVLIDAFAQLPPQVRDGWRLVLAGASAPSPEMDTFIQTLERRADGLDVTIETNVTPARMAELRDQARFFWHATGFDRPASHPERAEHFGMSTAEAMSHGAIPLVFADGGQPEIVDEHTGRLWRTIPELVEQTASLMAQPPHELDAMAGAARVASARFGSDRFQREARALLHQLGALPASNRPGPRLLQAVKSIRRRARWELHRRALR